ncbi:MAG TPA: glycine oxidase ThiO [Rhizomicrobium sp.]|nr:glycine oxidase ThiO [Rhizomicrobium sp.]
MKVIVIGAGVAGLSIGWRLQQAGVAVTVFDRAQPSFGATWASAGMIAAGGELGGAQTPEAEFAHHSSGLWPAFATEVEETAGQSVHYRRCGALIVARSPTELAGLTPWGGAERLDAAQARAKEPMLAPDIAGAVWDPNEAQVDARRLGVALAKAFVRSGGTLVPNEIVLQVKVEAGRVAGIATPFTKHEADAYVIAAGAWSGGLDGLPGGAALPVQPVKGQMLAVAPSKDGRIPAHIIWGNDGYMVPRDDRLLIGATSEEVGFDTSLTDAAADLLSARARAVMPALGGWEVVERWAGLRPGSPDGRPILGRTAVDRLYAATGQYRNGILYAPAIAQHMLSIVLHQAPEIPAFDPRRFASSE